MKIDKKQASEDFDTFLMVMDDQLEALAKEAASRNIRLDMTPADLGRLEKLFDVMSAGLDKDALAGLVVSFARHLGEVVRTNYGGKWVLPLDDEKNINFNRPVITGHAQPAGLELAPITIMRAYALRRKPGTLKRAVDADVNPTALNLDDLIEK